MLRQLSDIECRAVRWLPGSRDRIPQGMVSVVAGLPSQRKSLFTAYLAAYVSQSADVLIVTCEEPLHENLRPRLEAANANLDRVHTDDLTLPDDLGVVAGVVRDRGVKLIVIDPIASHLGASVNRSTTSIRRVTNPLAKIAEETGVAAVLIEHTLKHISPRAHPLQAIPGSGSGLVAAARTIYIAGKDPEDDERMILCCVKPLRALPPALAFTIDEVSYIDADGREDTAAVLLPEKGPASEFTYDVRKLLVVESGAKTGRPAGKREAAAAWLSRYLFTAEGHESPQKEIIEDGRQNGHSSVTLKRAAQDMGIETRQRQRGWHWKLPPGVVEAMESGESGNGQA